MPQLQIFTMRGTLLDNVPCSSGECVKDLVKNAMESKKLGFEEARGIKRLEKDGSWTKIRWKDLADDDNAVYKVTRDPQKLRLKHRVYVVDYNGEEIGRFPSKSGMSVLNIMYDVCRQLEIDIDTIITAQIRFENGFKRVSNDTKINFSDRLVLTLDELDRDRIRIENGEPILPRCLTVLKLPDLLRDYVHPLKGREPRGKSINVEELIKKLESGKSIDEDEMYLVSRSSVEPLCRHSIIKGRPWKNECRLYLSNLFSPYPQLHVEEFVSPRSCKVERNPFENALANKQFISLTHKKNKMKKLLKNIMTAK